MYDIVKSNARIKTLVVEPNPDVRRQVMAALVRCGCEPTSIDEVAEVCTSHASESYNLMAVGVDSSEDRGAGLCSGVSSVPDDRRAVVLAITESDDPEHLAALREAGADDCLSLPIDQRRLAVLVALARRRADEAARNGELPFPLSLCLTRGRLAQDAPFGVFRSSAEDGFLEASRTVVTMLGYDSEEELLALDTTKDLYRNPADRDELYSRLTDDLRGEELDWKRKDGTPIVVRVSGQAVRDAKGALSQFIGLVEDVSEKRRATQRLRQTVDELMAIYEGMPDGLLATDGPTNHFIRVNPAMCRMTGYSEEELLGLSIEDIHPEWFLPEVRRHFAAQSAGTTREVANMPVLRKDGTIIYCDITAGVLFLDGRRYAVGFFRDVTERQQAAVALAESESRFRAVFESAAMGIVLVDFDARFVDANDTYARFTGYSREELVGRSIADVTHPEEWAEEQRRIEEFVASGLTTGHYEKRMLHKDGGTIWVGITASVLPGTNDIPPMLLGVVENITDRRLAEEALRESEGTLRGLIENMPDVVFMTDPNWTIQYINRDTPELDAKNLVGQNAMEYCWPSYRKPCQHLMHKAAQEGTVQTFEAMDAFQRWWACRLVPVSEGGTVRNFMLIASDVSQRKKAEQAVQEEQELLRNLLDLFERDRELVAFEIHDGFSQQLTGALLNFEAVAQACREVSKTTADGFDNGVRLLRESIAESRRLVRGLRPPVLDEYGIVPAIEHLIEDHRAGGGVEVEFVSGIKIQRLARPLESALFRIVQETLNNIRRHSQSDKVRIELIQIDPTVRLVVRDWGAGFAVDEVDTNRFGLRGIRERARLLGGRAEIESTPGEGTRVCVELPLLEWTLKPNRP